MTSDLAVRAAAPLETKIEYARFLAEADLLPRAYQGKPANLLYAIEYGEMLGLPPIAAVVAIHVIDGKPTMSAGLMAAKVRQAGHRIRVQSNGLTGDGAAARCTITRSDDPDFEYSATWTMERAKTAGLLGKTNWRQHPIQMLKNRATSECCRDACQEVLLGIHYTPDELDGDDDGGELVDDGFPVLPNGQLDQTQMSEASKEQAGLMTRGQRIAHDELRDMNKIDPAAVQHLDGTPGDDPWQLPGAEKSPPAPESWVRGLIKLMAPLPLGEPADVAALVSWLAGRSLTGPGDPTLTRSEVKLIGDIVKDHCERAEGDTELAASRLWEQYQAAQPADAQEVPGE